MKDKKEKLNNSQIRVMQLLWEKGPVPAKELCIAAADAYEWNKNTTYTIIRTLVEAGVIERNEPDFVCTPLVSIEEVRRTETKSFIEKFYEGSTKTFLSIFLEDENLGSEEFDIIKQLVNKSKG